MRKSMWISLAALLLLTNTAAFSAETKQVLVRGAGQENCAKWLRERANWLTGASQAYFNWTLGFIAAYNDFVHTQEPTNNSGVDFGLDSDPLLAWLDQYCRAQPGDTIYAASNALITDLKKRQQGSPSSPPSQ